MRVLLALLALSSLVHADVTAPAKPSTAGPPRSWPERCAERFERARGSLAEEVPGFADGVVRWLLQPTSIATFQVVIGDARYSAHVAYKSKKGRQQPWYAHKNPGALAPLFKSRWMHGREGFMGIGSGEADRGEPSSLRFYEVFQPAIDDCLAMRGE